VWEGKSQKAEVGRTGGRRQRREAEIKIPGLNRVQRARTRSIDKAEIRRSILQLLTSALRLLPSDSGRAAEADEIVEVEQIEPCADVVPIRSEFLECFVKVLPPFVVRRSAPQMVL
jgi:hypothetical protein